VVVVPVAAELEAALRTVAPSAPPAIDPVTTSAIAPLRLMSIGNLLRSVDARERLARVEERRRAHLKIS
jgi:hypothetical protein